MKQVAVPRSQIEGAYAVLHPVATIWVEFSPTHSLAMAPLTRNAARATTPPLPPELWGIIIGHLPIRDWYHLALASKMLWQLQPERICMTEFCTGEREGFYFILKHCERARFFRLVLNGIDAAAELYTALDDLHMDKPLAQLKELEVQDDNEFFGGTFALDRLLCAVPDATPNLKHASIDGFFTEMPLVPSLQSLSLSTLTIYKRLEQFTALKTLTLSGEPHHNGRKLDLTGLPALEDVYLEDFTPSSTALPKGCKLHAI